MDYLLSRRDIMAMALASPGLARAAAEIHLEARSEARPEMNDRPFAINIPQGDIENLLLRLRNSRWPDQVQDSGWAYGTEKNFLKRWVSRWADSFDWRREEDKLNQLRHRMASLDGSDLHYLRFEGKGENPYPLLMLHGWPSSFVQMIEAAKMLSNPEQEGVPSFTVIVPSLPGFGFSSIPKAKGMNVFAMGSLIGKLMTEVLGFKSFAIRGSDLGAGVASGIAALYPQAVTAFHFSGSSPFVFSIPENLSESERQFIAEAENVRRTEGAYAALHATKPQTLAYGLNDSPAGLAAWILEKMQAWSDCNGDLDSIYSQESILTNLSIYWFTQTINSSMRCYYESFRAAENSGSWGRSPVPTAMAMPRKDIIIAPREWEERSLSIVRWTEMEKGGHFLEWEQPELIVKDIREFLKKDKN